MIVDQQHAERLSALVDGELSDNELKLAAGHLAETRELHATWQRYHLIGDILRDEASEGLHGLRVAARVREALTDEPVVLAPRRRDVTAWKPVVGFAIAATVATVAVISVQPGTVSDSGAPVVASAAPVPSSSAVSPTPAPDVFDREMLASSAEADTGAVDAPADRRLNSYLVNFNEQRASMGMPGAHPHVRTVGYDGNR